MEKNFTPINVSLNNEQIKALPTTPIEIAPAKEGQQIVVCLDEEQKEIGLIYITQTGLKSSSLIIRR